jgi:hypothetical protein
MIVWLFYRWTSLIMSFAHAGLNQLINVRACLSGIRTHQWFKAPMRVERRSRLSMSFLHKSTVDNYPLLFARGEGRGEGFF